MRLAIIPCSTYPYTHIPIHPYTYLTTYNTHNFTHAHLKNIRWWRGWKQAVNFVLTCWLADSFCCRAKVWETIKHIRISTFPVLGKHRFGQTATHPPTDTKSISTLSWWQNYGIKALYSTVILQLSRKWL